MFFNNKFPENEKKKKYVDKNMNKKYNKEIKRMSKE